MNRAPRAAIVSSKIALGLYLVAFIPVVILTLLDDYFDTGLLWSILGIAAGSVDGGSP